MADIATKQPTPAERSLAGWESATARTMNPLVDDVTAEAFWKIVIANRQKPDADAFQKSVTKLFGASAPAGVHRAIASIVANLRDVLDAGTPAAQTRTAL